MKHPVNDVLKSTCEVIRYHHERWDGKGYPDGLKGTEIPLSARIVKLADVFDALTSDRCYRNAYSPEGAIEIMKSDADAFDPEILELFLKRTFFMFLERRKQGESHKTKSVSD
ncbi:HD domain-containing phosphohydrolase [Pseudothermotoga sp.]|uniref:HD-GYP domain-containing protein n=1 Tax=Pseudothermotoga sp. TaxID=2033661 RepID=UPI0031FCEAFA